MWMQYGKLRSDTESPLRNKSNSNQYYIKLRFFYLGQQQHNIGVACHIRVSGNLKLGWRHENDKDTG
jgi:hypothetical protein